MRYWKVIFRTAKTNKMIKAVSQSELLWNTAFNDIINCFIRNPAMQQNLFRLS